MLLTRDMAVMICLLYTSIDDLETTDPELYAWAVNGKSTRQAKVEITKLFRELTILECDEVESYYLNDKTLLLDFIEELYNFWKRHQRLDVYKRQLQVMMNQFQLHIVMLMIVMNLINTSICH